MPGFSNDDTQEVSSPDSAINRGNSLAASSTPYTAQGAAPVYSGSPAAAVASNNGLVNSSFSYGGSSNNNANSAASFVTAPWTSPSAAPEGGNASMSSMYSPLSQPQQDKLFSTAQSLGANPADLYGVLNYETNRTFDPGVVGGKDDAHLGLIQFGPNEQKKYGVSKDQSFDDQLDSAAKYLKDRGFKPGMGLAHMYSIVNAGSLKPNGEPRYNARDQNATVRQHIAQIQQHFYPSAGNAVASAAPDASATPDVPPTPEMRPYRQGDGYNDPNDAAAIAQYQQALADRGYYLDTIDGKFGPKTRAAVNAARQNAGMSLNGMLDSDLQARLTGGPAPGIAVAGVEPALAPEVFNPKLSDAMGGGRATISQMTAPPDSYTQAKLDAQAPATITPHVATQGDNVEVRPGTGPGRSPTGNALVANAAPATPFVVGPKQAAINGVIPGGNWGETATGAPATVPDPQEAAREALGLPSNAVAAAPSSATPVTAPVGDDPLSYAPTETPPVAAPIAAPVAPPGTIPAGDRVRPAPTTTAPIDKQQQLDDFRAIYKTLPPGAIYTDPNGVTRRKGGGKTSDASKGNTKVAAADTVPTDPWWSGGMTADPGPELPLDNYTPDSIGTGQPQQKVPPKTWDGRQYATRSRQVA